MSASALQELPSDLPTYLLRLSLIAAASYTAVVLLIPVVCRHVLPVQLSGKDLCKRGTPAGDIPM